MLLFSNVLVISLAFVAAQGGSETSEVQPIGTSGLWSRRDEPHHRRQTPEEKLCDVPELEDVDFIEPFENLVVSEPPPVYTTAHHEKIISSDNEQASHSNQTVNNRENYRDFVPTWRRNPPPPIIIPEVIDPFFGDHGTRINTHVLRQPRKPRITQGVHNVFRQQQSRPPRAPSSDVRNTDTTHFSGHTGSVNLSEWWNWYENSDS